MRNLPSTQHTLLIEELSKFAREHGFASAVDAAMFFEEFLSLRSTSSSAFTSKQLGAHLSIEASRQDAKQVSDAYKGDSFLTENRLEEQMVILRLVPSCSLLSCGFKLIENQHKLGPRRGESYDDPRLLVVRVQAPIGRICTRRFIETSSRYPPSIGMSGQSCAEAKRGRNTAFEGAEYEVGDAPPLKRHMHEHGVLRRCSNEAAAPGIPWSVAVCHHLDEELRHSSPEFSDALERYSDSVFPVKGGKSMGIVDLSWDMIREILKLLPREDWGGFALTCKRFRVDLTLICLREARVLTPDMENSETWNLEFSSLSSFKILNRHWRLGPLFRPVEKVTFFFPYDEDERRRCMLLVSTFFKSLGPGVQHIEYVSFSLGTVWDGGETASGIDLDVIHGMLRDVHWTGCTKLSILSVDMLDLVDRVEPSSDILVNSLRDEQLHLESLSLETITFSSPTLISWFMRQVTGSTTITHLKLCGTGFTAAQLDVILCYFELPQLVSIVIGDAWLASVIEFLRGSPRLNIIHLQHLSPDFRVPNGSFVSLPGLHTVRGDATTLNHFIPLLQDVAWDIFREVEIDTNVTNGANDELEHSLDADSCINIFKILVCNGADLECLALAFPSLAKMSFPLFDANAETCSVLNSCKVNRLRVRMNCEAESETGELMGAIIPWICQFHSLRSVMLYSVRSHISVSDGFAFKAELNSIRPRVAVMVL